jgi:hypothetical protein
MLKWNKRLVRLAFQLPDISIFLSYHMNINHLPQATSSISLVTNHHYQPTQQYLDNHKRMEAWSGIRAAVIKICTLIKSLPTI